MTRYEIIKGMPPPLTRKSGSKYPLAMLAVGESFAVESALRGAVTQAAYRHMRSNKTTRFTIRKCPEGYRVWRIQ